VDGLELGVRDRGLNGQRQIELGPRFAERPDACDGKRPVREMVGVDPRLARFWSKRRQVITAREEQLEAEFAATRGRTPDFAEQTRLFARATTDTRQRRHAPRSEREQRAAWWQDAAAVLGSDQSVLAMVREALSQPLAATAEAVEGAWVARTAADAVRSVPSSRARGAAAPSERRSNAAPATAASRSRR